MLFGTYPHYWRKLSRQERHEHRCPRSEPYQSTYVTPEASWTSSTQTSDVGASLTKNYRMETNSLP
jgi:hypothetical protein